MKKSKINMFLASALAMGIIVLTPFVSSAQENSSNSHKEVRAGSDNSIWTRLEGFFTPKHADAAVSQTPSISGITAPTVLSVGQTGRWTVNASDPQNSPLNYSVNWGDQAAQPLLRMFEQPAFVQTSTFTHAYQAAGTYTVTFTVSNSAGRSTTSTVTVNVSASSVAAPVISGFTATSTKPRQATLAWTTDIASSSLAWYGTTTPINTSAKANVNHTSKVVNHSITLTKLTPATTYYVVVGSAKNGSSTTLSSQLSFTTAPAATDNTTPVITSLSGDNTVVAGDVETVTVNATDPRNSPLTYKADWGDSASVMPMAPLAAPFAASQSATFSHTYAVAGTYTATFTAENNLGKTATSSMTITVTPASGTTTGSGPVASNIGTQVVTTVTWTTDVPATSKIFYSTTSPVDVSSSSTASVSDSNSVTDHAMTISGLQANTLYYFVIQSTDTSGNISTSSQSSFTTSS